MRKKAVTASTGVPSAAVMQTVHPRQVCRSKELNSNITLKFMPLWMQETIPIRSKALTRFPVSEKNLSVCLYPGITVHSICFTPTGTSAPNKLIWLIPTTAAPWVPKTPTNATGKANKTEKIPFLKTKKSQTTAIFLFTGKSNQVIFPTDKSSGHRVHLFPARAGELCGTFPAHKDSGDETGSLQAVQAVKARLRKERSAFYDRSPLSERRKAALAYKDVSERQPVHATVPTP